MEEWLKQCFEEPHAEVHYRLLAHNHIMLILRAWIQCAQWNTPPDTERGLVFCDGNGYLCVENIIKHNNGKELGKAIQDGMRVEILSWNMDVEEPGAASIISQALNEGHAKALSTTELTAVAVLKGEIILQSKDISRGVMFDSVIKAVRRQLDGLAEDPDLIELFDFLMS